MKFLAIFPLIAACSVAAKKHKLSKTSSSTGHSTMSDYENVDGHRIKPSKPTASPAARTYGKEVPYSVLGNVQDYDRSFVMDWWRLMRQLWTADGQGKNGIDEEMPTSALEFLPRDSEKPIRVSQAVAYWKPVSCKHLGFKLQHVKTLQNNGKNLVLLMRDTQTKQQFVYKTFSDPGAYTSELVFSQFVRPGNEHLVPAVCFLKHEDEEEAKEKRDRKPALLYKYVRGEQSLNYARNASLEDLQRISAELLAAIQHIHYLGYLHADLKPHNVIIGSDGSVQVIDFGFTTPIENGKRNQGTHITMAPELYRKVPGLVHEGIDWWAYGATVAMWYGAYYDEKEYRRQHRGKASGRKGSRSTFVPLGWDSKKNRFTPGNVPEAFPRTLRSFLFHFFHIDPDTRLYNTERLIEGLRNHEFFEGVNWTEIDASLNGGN